MKKYLNFISDNSFHSFVALIIFIVYITIEIYRLKKNNSFQMDSGPLTRQALFWASIRIPTLSFLYFGFFSWAGKDLRFDYLGFNHFIEISKLPLGMLSISIPFVAIVNNIHRTIQTDDQIQQTKKKNRIDEFYAHQKSHIDYFTSIMSGKFFFKPKPRKRGTVVIHNISGVSRGEDEDEYKEKEFSINVDSPFKLYRATFHNASTDNNDFIINTQFTSRLKNNFEQIHKQIKSIEDNNDEISALEIFSSIELRLSIISSELLLTPLPLKNTYMIISNDFNFSTRFEEEIHLKRAMRVYIKIMREYLDIIKDNNIPHEIFHELTLYCYSDKNIFPLDNGWKLQNNPLGYTGFSRTIN